MTPVGLGEEIPWIDQHCVICRVELRDPHHLLLERYRITMSSSSLEECETRPRSSS